MQGLSLALELFAGLHGQGEEVGFPPVARLQIDQRGDPAGVQVADATEQLQSVALGQVLQAVDQQGQVETLCGQFRRQGRSRCGGDLTLRMCLFEGIDSG